MYVHVNTPPRNTARRFVAPLIVRSAFLCLLSGQDDEEEMERDEGCCLAYLYGV
jgi:hypothetical protein